MVLVLGEGGFESDLFTVLMHLDIDPAGVMNVDLFSSARRMDKIFCKSFPDNDPFTVLIHVSVFNRKFIGDLLTIQRSEVFFYPCCIHWLRYRFGTDHYVERVGI